MLLLKREYFFERTKLESFQNSLDYMDDIIPNEFTLMISHRWLTESHPDPHSRQFVVIRRYLSLTHYTHVFYDYSCLPQGVRNYKDELYFKNVLKSLNYLYDRHDKLVLASKDYFQRAWCVMEYVLGDERFPKFVADDAFIKKVNNHKIASKRGSMCKLIIFILSPIYLALTLFYLAFSLFLRIFSCCRHNLDRSVVSSFNKWFEAFFCCLYRRIGLDEWRRNVRATNGSDIDMIYNMLSKSTKIKPPSYGKIKSTSKCCIRPLDYLRLIGVDPKSLLANCSTKIPSRIVSGPNIDHSLKFCGCKTDDLIISPETSDSFISRKSESFISKMGCCVDIYSGGSLIPLPVSCCFVRADSLLLVRCFVPCMDCCPSDLTSKGLIYDPNPCIIDMTEAEDEKFSSIV
jgi:hypothetical protein